MLDPGELRVIKLHKWTRNSECSLTLRYTYINTVVYEATDSDVFKKIV